MVVSNIHIEQAKAVFVVQPNNSLSWSQCQWVLGVIAVFLLCVCAYFASLGAWLILPFAGVEMLLLALGFYLHSVSAHSKQIIEIDRQQCTIRIQRRHRSVTTADFPIAWLQVNHTPHQLRWYPTQLWVGAHGRFIEVGRCLLEDEREALAVELHRAVCEIRALPKQQLP